MRRRAYSLRKSRRILKSACRWYERHGKTLPRGVLSSLEELLASCDRALLASDREESYLLAKEIERFTKKHLKRSSFLIVTELLLALFAALAIAVVVRQCWFEPYQIPTGSMRPTFKELDLLTASKTAFGINIPLTTGHLYFDPSLVERTGAIIWSGEGVPHLRDVHSTYFGMIPYTKRYIKRLIGKPGDTLYFYGGKIWGIDREGEWIQELLNGEEMTPLEHIPFMTFEGEVTATRGGMVLFGLMNETIGRAMVGPNGVVRGEVFNGARWLPDRPQAAPGNAVATYSDLWGIGNFAMARLLTQEQLEPLTGMRSEQVGEGLLYLELRHHPSLARLQIVPFAQGGASVLFDPYISVIPLKKAQLERLMETMVTSRFVVQGGRAYSYNGSLSRNSPPFPNVPDGTYEFDRGKALSVGWGGVTQQLEEEHPLYEKSAANIQRLFNLGVQFHNFYAPVSPVQRFYPHRYGYFKEGALHLMGAPFLERDDPLLVAFNARETERAKGNYVPFQDIGPPLINGKIDRNFIRTFGLTVPDNHYLLLGDNHANSADSRVCGFIPEANLQGVPSFLLWPPSRRWGIVASPYSTFVLPRLAVWMIAIVIAGCWWIFDRQRAKQPLFHQIKSL